MRFFLVTLIIFSSLAALAQVDSTEVRDLKITADFRFRLEQDWNSRNANGALRDDRMRLRYRFRFGLNYQLDKHSSFGGRIRTGNINDQQGPHLTLGGGNGEFGLAQIGFEKLYYQFKRQGFKSWVGKNAIHIKKTNELFWNDNVFPEGIAIQYGIPTNKSNTLDELKISAAHFVIQSKGEDFLNDAYMQVAQLEFILLDNNLSVFPGFYYFHDLGNIPDQQHEYLLDYKIFHLGSEAVISKKHNLRLSAELYTNLQNYDNRAEIPSQLRDQTNGFVITAKYGKLKKKGDFTVDLYYAYLERFAIVDYFAQNDWARWDYSGFDASGSRLSNFHGVELRIGYAFKEKFNLIFRAYQVEQLVAEGLTTENGSRVRLDLNIGF